MISDKSSDGCFHLPSYRGYVRAPIGFGRVLDIHAEKFVSHTRSFTKVFAGGSEVKTIYFPHYEIDAGFARWKPLG